MLTFPNTPFLNEKFSQRSGGIDFLGMRWVNLRMLGVNLLPGVSNATSDVGTYLLGAWIPWKFLELSKNDKNHFKLSTYKKYREAIEVAISHASRDESPSADKFGKPINRIGNLQKIKLPADMVDSCQGENSFPAPFFKGYCRLLLQGISRDGTYTATIDHSDIRGFDRMTCLHRGAVSL